MPKTKTVKKKIHSRKKQSPNNRIVVILLVIILIPASIFGYKYYKQYQQDHKDIDSFQAEPLFHAKPLAKPSVVPVGTTPTKLRLAYGLGGTGGSGTIAIIDAHDAPTVESDLAAFNSQFGLPACTTVNGCFEKHKMSESIGVSSDWALEAALDVQWSHAIAPGAKILLVEANSASGTDLLNAVNYARNRSDVVAISMSWGGDEFGSEASYESYFTSNFGASFFAASGDSGHGLSWPAVSANVISVGGTKLSYNSRGTKLNAETGWRGSGGGTSRYISAPSRQTAFGVPKSLNKRAVPDVSYNADPSSGFPVYNSTPYIGYSGWFIVGGTSAGAPQWAAIKALSPNLTANLLYSDAAKPRQKYLRDITSGNNGSCGFYCSSKKGFDYVTGLGSPLTINF